MRAADRQLLDASFRGRLLQVKQLLNNPSPNKRADPNITDNKGGTPLFHAAKNGHTEIVRELLIAGADPNIANRINETPLYWAAEKEHLKIAKYLLSHGADPNYIDSDNQTALHAASWYGYSKFVKELLMYGVDPSIITVHNESALDIAIRKNNTDVVEILQHYFPSLQHLSLRFITKNKIDIPESVEDLLSR